MSGFEIDLTKHKITTYTGLRSLPTLTSSAPAGGVVIWINLDLDCHEQVSNLVRLHAQVLKRLILSCVTISLHQNRQDHVL